MTHPNHIQVTFPGWGATDAPSQHPHLDQPGDQAQEEEEIVTLSTGATNEFGWRPASILRLQEAPSGPVMEGDAQVDDPSSRWVWVPDMEVIRRRMSAPRPPQSPFTLFHRDKKPEVMAAMRGQEAECSELVGRICEMWSSMPTYKKGTWIAKALWDRERYSRELSVCDDGPCRPRRTLESDSQYPKASCSASLGDGDAMLVENPHAPVPATANTHTHTHAHGLQHDESGCVGLCAHTSVHECAAEGDLRSLKALVEGDVHLVNLKDEDGMTPLMTAALYSDYATVDYLLSMGADPLIGVEGGVTPAHVAATKDVSMLVRLLEGERGRMAIGLVDDSQRTLLHYACMSGRSECVEALLERHAHTHVCDEDGHTPLDLACAERVTEIVEIESMIRRASCRRKASRDHRGKSNKNTTGMHTDVCNTHTHIGVCSMSHTDVSERAEGRKRPRTWSDAVKEMPFKPTISPVASPPSPLRTAREPVSPLTPSPTHPHRTSRAHTHAHAHTCVTPPHTLSLPPSASFFFSSPSSPSLASTSRTSLQGDWRDGGPDSATIWSVGSNLGTPASNAAVRSSPMGLADSSSGGTLVLSSERWGHIVLGDANTMREREGTRQRLEQERAKAAAHVLSPVAPRAVNSDQHDEPPVVADVDMAEGPSLGGAIFAKHNDQATDPAKEAQGGHNVEAWNGGDEEGGKGSMAGQRMTDDDGSDGHHVGGRRAGAGGGGGGGEDVGDRPMHNPGKGGTGVLALIAACLALAT